MNQYSNIGMKYRKLGKTGLNTSVIGLGTDQFYGEWALLPLILKREVDFVNHPAIAVERVCSGAAENAVVVSIAVD